MIVRWRAVLRRGRATAFFARLPASACLIRTMLPRSQDGREGVDMGILRWVFARGGPEERRHREQLAVARKGVRVAKVSLAVTVVTALIGFSLAWLLRSDGSETVGGSPAGEIDATSTSQPEDPLAVTVRVSDGHCTEWFGPGPLEEIEFTSSPPVDSDGVAIWSGHPAAEGGGPASPQGFFFTVQGRTEADVVLTGLEVHVEERRPAPLGVVLDDQCGGAGAFRWLGVNLDSDPPEILSYFSESLADLGDPTVTEDELEPVRFPYHVSASEAEVFSVTAYALDCDCEWWIELSWESMGRSGTTRIDNEGELFRTIGLSNAVGTCLGDGRCTTPLPEYYTTELGPPTSAEVDQVVSPADGP